MIYNSEISLESINIGEEVNTSDKEQYICDEMNRLDLIYVRNDCRAIK